MESLRELFRRAAAVEAALFERGAQRGVAARLELVSPWDGAPPADAERAEHSVQVARELVLGNVQPVHDRLPVVVEHGAHVSEPVEPTGRRADAEPHDERLGERAAVAPQQVVLRATPLGHQLVQDLLHLRRREPAVALRQKMDDGREATLRWAGGGGAREVSSRSQREASTVAKAFWKTSEATLDSPHGLSWSLMRFTSASSSLFHYAPSPSSPLTM